MIELWLLAGAFPLLHFIKRFFRGFLHVLATKIRVNDAAILGLLSSLAHSIPMFELVKAMNPRGKVLNFAFVVSGSFVLSSHLAFTASVDQAMIIPMMVGKLTAAACALVVAHVMTRKEVESAGG